MNDYLFGAVILGPIAVLMGIAIAIIVDTFLSHLAALTFLSFGG